jgi:hypothetical protein
LQNNIIALVIYRMCGNSGKNSKNLHFSFDL